MGWPVCNTTEAEAIEEIPLWDGGITFHALALLVGGACAIIACIVSLVLILLHATHYSKPIEQRHIIRILFMVPVYSLVAWLSIFFYHDAVYFKVLGDCYEAFCISAFFSLMCHYIAPDLHSQKDYFRGIQPKEWLWPLSWLQKCCGGERIWRTPRSGLTWFNIVWVGVFQYCLMRVLMTIVAVVAQAFGVYCEESLSPAFAHIWTIVIESVSVTIAMYCLIQFYHQTSQDIKQHQPFLKILSIKLVIFLSFWQSTLINLLVSEGAISATNKMAMNDLKVGLPELMINCEMAIFAILHLWAFSWKSYTLANQSSEVTDFYGNGKAVYQGGRYGIRALFDAMNPLDLFKAIGRSARWLFVGRKSRTLDPSYQPQQSFGLQPPQEGSELTEHGTAYHGASTVIPGGRTGRYGETPYEEGEVLLAHAQPNPEIAPGTSPYASDLDDHAQNPSTGFYRRSSSPYGAASLHSNDNLYSESPVHPYPSNGPLREQVPMPMPDPYHPPPPYPTTHHP
ncbi:Organic solute transporter Ost-alpha [Penicillium griseofulvum]|uniref:Organic solute transporter Ost-alpha n=1 Tax=Penicillium patulum TaxID=5078 RepID=A0A135LLJ6_PENPA|nr:Organic solute transporter Ost-alpha [Penicillium griseofulvum]KXG49804.1 Organic solute transporter Ost-alpha [Penicillium griseofulvum]